MAFKRPKPTSDFPELHNDLLQSLWGPTGLNNAQHPNLTLIKVTSHLEDKRVLPNIEENEFADKAADVGALFSLAHPSHQTPSFTEWRLSSLSTVVSSDFQWGRQTEGWNYLVPPDQT